MAALGAPEVITQLESAAKVLMVRISSSFYGRDGDGGRLFTAAWPEFGGSRFREVFLNAFMLKIGLRAMRGAEPRYLSPSQKEKNIYLIILV